MGRSWGFVRSFILFVLFFSLKGFGFVGKDNTEAWLRFSHFVEVESEKKPTKEQQFAAIEEQLLYLYGPLSMDVVYAAPKGEHSFDVGYVEEIEADTFRIYYDYEGLIQLKKGPRTKYTVILPRQTSEEFIYDPGVNDRTGKNMCTEDYHNSYGDFWYFWGPKPYYKKCPLEEGVHYDLVEGSIERIPNTKLSYPEYERLIDKATGEVSIFVFIGMHNPDIYMDDPIASEKFPKKDDYNAPAYRKIRSMLVKMGFSKPERLSNEEMSRILDKHRYKRPYVEVLTKEGKRANIKVTLFFGPTGIDENSKAFHYFYKEASEKASLMIYDGHSGLGGHLDLAMIEQMHDFEIRLPRKRYQIFFFNSCTSYSYYNTLYFYRKQGKSTRYQTKNLDILTDGLATEFEENQKTNLALIRAVDKWVDGGRPTSYQTLADEMDQRNLFGVNGDEDND